MQGDVVSVSTIRSRVAQYSLIIMTAEFLLGKRCNKYPTFGEQKEGERRELDRIFAVVIVVVIRKGRHLFISVVIVVRRPKERRDTSSCLSQNI